MTCRSWWSTSSVVGFQFFVAVSGNPPVVAVSRSPLGCLLFTLENALLGWDSVLDNVPVAVSRDSWTVVQSSLFGYHNEPSYVLPGHFCVIRRRTCPREFIQHRKMTEERVVAQPKSACLISTSLNERQSSSFGPDVSNVHGGIPSWIRGLSKEFWETAVATLIMRETGFG